MEDDFVSDTRLNEMINRSVGIWHGMLVKAVPERYEAVDTITANGATGYNLPADYLSTLAVEYQDSNNNYIDIPRAMFNERNYWPASQPFNIAAAYRTNATQLLLLPPPLEGDYRHIYVTCADTLSMDGDTVDGVNGWEEWIVYDVAIKMLLKIQDPVSELQVERARVEQSMQAAAADRNEGAPMRVQAVRRRPRERDWDFWIGR